MYNNYYYLSTSYKKFINNNCLNLLSESFCLNQDLQNLRIDRV